MSRKNKTKGHKATDLFRSAQQSFAKQDYKQALKDAKVAWRQEPSDERRRFLEQAYLERGRQLARHGLRDESRAVIDDLLRMGITDASVQDGVTSVAISVGLFDRVAGAQGAPQIASDPHLLAATADAAVLHPEQAPSSLPEVRRLGRSVRAALEQLEKGESDEAQAALRDIPRNSPFADWRLFVRGLAAYYRQDFAEMRSSWDRLEAGRAAAKIAAPLRSLADATESGTPVSDDNVAVRSLVTKVENAVFGQPVLTRLYELRSRVIEENWEGVMRSLRRLCEPLRQRQPQFLDRLARVLLPTVIDRGSTDLMGALTEAIPGPPTDPRWNRAWALFFEHPDEGDWEEAEAFWQDYLDDLKQMTALTPHERKLAQALVWQRIGQEWLLETRGPLGSGGPFGCDEGRAGNLAIKAFRRSIELAPELREAYHVLAKTQRAWRQCDQAVKTYRRLLKRFPEDLDGLVSLVELLLGRNDPVGALEYALRAQQLKPLDRDTARWVFICQIGAARHCALRGEREQGRAAMAAAEAVGWSTESASALPVHKAVFELKAGELAHGRHLARQAVAAGGDPAPVLLQLAIEAGRYEVADHLVLGFERDWKDQLKAKCRSAAAGGMARVLMSFIAPGGKWLGLKPYVKLVLGYLGRAARVKWAADDLRAVCELLRLLTQREDFSRAEGLLEKFLKRGLKSFPQSAVFYAYAGEIEMDGGPEVCDRPYARYLFRRAVEGAERSGDPRDKPILDDSRRALNLLGPGDESPRPSRREPAPFGDSVLGGIFDRFARMFNEMGVDPDEVYEAARRFAGGSALPRGPEQRK